MKITLYDLLGMVKNGKQPKTIKINGHYYVYDELENDYCEGMGYDYKYLFKNITIYNLNDEVEIPVPKRIPEKLRTWYSVEEEQSIEENCNYANDNFETMYEKINEIIDYLESKGESND